MIEGGKGLALRSVVTHKDRVELIVEPNDLRRAYISTHCPNRNDTTDNPPRTEFDLVVDGVGYEATRKLASEYARSGGVIAHIGLGSNAGDWMSGV